MSGIKLGSCTSKASDLIPAPNALAPKSRSKKKIKCPLTDDAAKTVPCSETISHLKAITDHIKTKLCLLQHLFVALRDIALSERTRWTKINSMVSPRCGI